MTTNPSRNDEPENQRRGKNLLVSCWVSGNVVSRYKGTINVGVPCTPTLSTPCFLLGPTSHLVVVEMQGRRGPIPSCVEIERQGRRGANPPPFVASKENQRGVNPPRCVMSKGKDEDGRAPLVAPYWERRERDSKWKDQCSGRDGSGRSAKGGNYLWYPPPGDKQGRRRVLVTKSR